ncbi:hypothetical protein DICPUDRAFT_158627, partial [Dictyostelium purpureum]
KSEKSGVADQHDDLMMHLGKIKTNGLILKFIKSIIIITQNNNYYNRIKMQ